MGSILDSARGSIGEFLLRVLRELIHRTRFVKMRRDGTINKELCVNNSYPEKETIQREKKKKQQQNRVVLSLSYALG